MLKKTPAIKKPRKDFPLFPHATGRWAKKVRQKMHYFGPTATDPKGQLALEKWLAQKDDLLAGRTPRAAQTAGLTLSDLANHFLNTKRNLVISGELTQRSHTDYVATCERLISTLGKDRLVDDLAADDFERLRAVLAKKMGPVALGNQINRARVLFKWGYDAGLIATPMRYGPGFKRPSKKTLRLARAAKGPRMFEAEELRAIIDAAGQPVKAMTLLAANCGFGQSDIARLPQSAIDFKAGWIDYARLKTGIPRRCPLWPETIAAVQEAIATRPEPKDQGDGNLAFLTQRGVRWVRSQKSKTGKPLNIDSVATEFAKVMKKLGLNGGRNFYAIRHGFQTVAEGARDMAAAQAIMGHVPATNDMGATYRERIDDERLQAVVNHVHGWLWPVADKKETK